MDALLDWESLPVPVRKHWHDVLQQTPMPPASFGDVAATVSRELAPEEWAAIVAGDLVLSGKVLAVANSAAMGLVKPATDVRRAVVHLGSNLTRIIVVGYFVEGLLGRWEHYPREFFQFVRRWSACSSVLAYQIARVARLPEREMIGTTALLARLGSLLLALEWPPPGDEYIQQTDEIARLEHELAKWEIGSPVLGARLARHWALPDPLPALIEQQCLPLLTDLPASDTNRALTAVTAALVLALGFLRTPMATAGDLLSVGAYLTLQANLASLELAAPCADAWGSSGTQKELLAISEA